MKATDNIDLLRNEYLAALAELASFTVDRSSRISSDMGMNALQSPKEAEENAKALATITRRLAEVCNKLRAIDQRSRGVLGVPALFAVDVPNAIRDVIAILVGKSLSGSWPHECRNLGNLLPASGGADPQELITVREAFRKGGLMRQHIHAEPGRTLDELANLTLSEASFRKLLALEPDSECDELAKARALVAAVGTVKR